MMASLNRIVRGAYTYLKDSSDRPVFRHNTETDLCLFWFGTWKVDLCTFLTSTHAVGFIYSSAVNTESPADSSLAWSYYEGSGQGAVVVKCGSKI